MAQQHLSGNLRLRQAWPKIEANTTELYERTEPASEEKAGLMSAEDKAKLDGIEEGAQVNQNAFARVNDLEATNPSDTVTITGGTGITATTNPNTKEVIITATGEATPGPHGSSHTEYGSDPIPAATTTEGGLMSAAQVQMLESHASRHAAGGPDEITPEMIGAETPAGAQAKVDAHAEKKATAGQIGHVRPDGTTIQVNGDGVISATDLPTKVSKTGDLMTGDLRMADQSAVTFGGRFKIQYNASLNALEFGVI